MGEQPMLEHVTIWTYDWVPDGPRGYVRDIRLRWALEEAGIAYEIASVRFDERGPDHIARQPFGQIPFLDDGEVRVFESGACLLHLAEKSEALMPRDAQGRAETVQWLIAGLNSIEMVSVPWWFIKITTTGENPLADWLGQRFERLEAVLADREWLAASRFTVADILMSDALRLPKKLGALKSYGSLEAFVDRACARPAFQKAYRDQMGYFAAADEARSR